MKLAVYLGLSLAAAILSPASLLGEPRGMRSPLVSRVVIAGVIRGQVIEQGTGQPIASAQIAVVVGTQRLGALSDNSGAFVVRGVPAGRVTVSAQRIGYSPAEQAAVLRDGGEVEVNFSLARASARLEAVVSTATGPQSRREVGNSIATIQADSIVKQAPVTNISEFLQARTAGVQVLQGSGETGASASIRIRGTSSLSLSNEPLIILDGVRIDNSPVPQGVGTRTLTSTSINRLNAIDPNEIESVDVVKGPSAAALYGTAAANGVVIITTKRGTSGETRWNVYGEGGVVAQPARFPANYRAWGRNLTAGVPGTAAVLCRISDQSLGRCVRDSLTTFNPLMDPSTTPIRSGTRFVAGVQVSGGPSNVTYFVSAERETERGPFQMPDAEVARLATARGIAPTPQQIHPNDLQQTSMSGNFGVPLGPSARLSVSTRYSDRELRTPYAGGFFAGLAFQSYFAPGFRTATGGTSAQYIGEIFSLTQTQRDQRFTGSTSLHWQALPWLETRAVAGMDQNQGYGTRFAFFGQGPVGWGPPAQTGGLDANRNNFSRYSVDLGATATWQARSALSARTSAGAQWFKDEQYATAVSGYGLPPGAQNTNGATSQLTQQTTNENATYGAFIEEVLGWSDRRFLTFGVRTDKNSAFGSNVGNTVYPRAALSWVLSDEDWFPKQTLGANSVRLRAAYGQAGQFPTVTTAALQFLTPITVPINGVLTPALRLQSLGNPDLKPEVTAETEGGLDLGFLNDRVTVEATAYVKKSRDALVLNPLPPSVGSTQSGTPSQWQNLAAVENRGFELGITAQVLHRNAITWSTRFNGSLLDNKLVNAGNAQLAVTQGARNVVGYPLFGLWARPIVSFNDANGDGVLTESEVVVGDSAVYKGPTLPTREAGWTNTLGFLGDRIKVTALVDYRGGHYNQWGFENMRCASGNCRAVNDPTAPLADQAAAITTASAKLGNSVWGYFVPNDFIRFRELSVTASLPASLIPQRARLRDASVTVSGRNLGVLWTRYPGLDPEANVSVANTGGGNNDFYAFPPIRYWLVRINLGL